MEPREMIEQLVPEVTRNASVVKIEEARLKACADHTVAQLADARG